MGKQVTKAQLQDEVEKLRALVDHLETKCAGLTEQVEALRAGQQQRVTRKVFEFNPAVPGDFARAMNEARKHNGMVRRAQ